MVAQEDKRVYLDRIEAHGSRKDTATELYGAMAGLKKQPSLDRSAGHFDQGVWRNESEAASHTELGRKAQRLSCVRHSEKRLAPSQQDEKRAGYLACSAPEIG